MIVNKMALAQRKNGKTLKNYTRRFDEYYTRYAHVKDIFDNYIPHNSLKDKKIYCPCDSDKSNFVIYLKEHKDDLGYKELIYTWDDYNTHMDLFEECDLIITNPPFSKLIKEFIPILNKVKKEFFILGGMINVYSYYIHFEDKENIKFIPDIKAGVDEDHKFDVPEGCELSNRVEYIYITNLNSPCYAKPASGKNKKISDIYGIDKEGNRYRNYDMLRNVPDDEEGEILVPITVILENNRKYFDIINGRGLAQQYTDNEPRYIRCLVKRKKLEQQP